MLRAEVGYWMPIVRSCNSYGALMHRRLSPLIVIRVDGAFTPNTMKSRYHRSTVYRRIIKERIRRKLFFRVIDASRLPPSTAIDAQTPSTSSSLRTENSCMLSAETTEISAVNPLMLKESHRGLC